MIKDLLIEIGTEELPPASLNGLAGAFARGVSAELGECGIGHGEVIPYCTPRRLAVVVHDVRVQQDQQVLSRRGPSVAASFTPDGTATKAALGFAKSCGVSVLDLDREVSDKGEWLSYRRVQTGRSTIELLPQIVERSLGGLPIGKRMRWGCGDAEFVRPIHWLCLVFGTEIVPGSVLGVAAGNTTFGHRFHAPGRITVTAAGDYPGLLRDIGFVEPSFDQRRASIREQVERLAKECGLQADVSETLLDEVTGLVEWPRAIVASFDPAFLAVPAEVLIETMRKNQKYFPLRDVSGLLREKFVLIANIESKDVEQVRRGNERVIRPRFSDAKFFWELDLERPLESHFHELEAVVFHERLGTVAAKVNRVARIAHEIADLIGQPRALVERAAVLSRCDLVTSMVGEFPALQGTMGRYYAKHWGEDPAVCLALEEQYFPRFSGDSLPSGNCGRTLALADRLDTLVGVFGIGQRPTGAKDPYGLRRASIGVLRILIETPLELNLEEILQLASDGFGSGVIAEGTVSAVRMYMLDRLVGYYLDRGVAQDTLEAVLATGEMVTSDIDRKVRAIDAFRSLASCDSLISANRRIRNILTKVDGPVDIGPAPRLDLFSEGVELRLGERVAKLEETVLPLIAQRSFDKVLFELADLRDDVDCFFDEVLVMADDDSIRENRLRLVRRLRALFLHIADFSLLQ